MPISIIYPSFWMSPNGHTGYLFEQWVVRQFNKNQYKLREWRSDKMVNKISADSGMNPDLIFQCSNHPHFKFFAIKCKYRASMKYSSSCWAKPHQFKNYKTFQER